MKTVIPIMFVFLSIFFIGCIGTPPMNPETGNATSQETETFNQTGTTTGSEWCNAGKTLKASGPSGKSASYEVKGIVNYKGKQRCHAVGTFSDKPDQEMHYYYTKGGGTCFVVKNSATGTTLYENCAEP